MVFLTTDPQQGPASIRFISPHRYEVEAVLYHCLDISDQKKDIISSDKLQLSETLLDRVADNEIIKSQKICQPKQNKDKNVGNPHCATVMLAVLFGERRTHTLIVQSWALAVFFNFLILKDFLGGLFYQVNLTGSGLF